MYYKITNKESEVYQKLHTLRTKELQIQKDNIKAINKKIGLKWVSYLGHQGQQNFRRVNQYSGFEFKEPEKADLKIWKQHKDHAGVFVPNKKTSVGREMNEFLNNGLKGSNFSDVFKILNVDYHGRFTFPFVDIVGETILLFLGDNQEPKDENVIEITKKEFEQTRK